MTPEKFDEATEFERAALEFAAPITGSDKKGELLRPMSRDEQIAFGAMARRAASAAITGDLDRRSKSDLEHHLDRLVGLHGAHRSAASRRTSRTGFGPKPATAHEGGSSTPAPFSTSR